MSEQTLKPPPPPPHEPKLRFYFIQAVGILIFTFVALLAVFGFFGEREGTIDVNIGDISADIKYPSRLRYKTIAPITVEIRNRGGAPTPLRVLFPTNYIDKFSNVRFSPQPDQISTEHYAFDLGVIVPGETRMITAELQAENYGSFPGRIELQAGDSSAHADIRTISFP